jgi:hypothetical protein
MTSTGTGSATRLHPEQYYTISQHYKVMTSRIMKCDTAAPAVLLYHQSALQRASLHSLHVKCGNYQRFNNSFTATPLPLNPAPAFFTLPSTFCIYLFAVSLFTILLFIHALCLFTYVFVSASDFCAVSTPS